MLADWARIPHFIWKMIYEIGNISLVVVHCIAGKKQGFLSRLL